MAIEQFVANTVECVPSQCSIQSHDTDMINRKFQFKWRVKLEV